MAVTKIHPIKKTLYSAINYIISKEKTDEQKLVYSKNCIDRFAYIQFENTRKTHKVKGTVLAHHLIQSFLPDEVDVETAHKIGKKLCDKILGNDYEYVLATHIDKGHIHNHIIFNNVIYTTGKCYQSNKKSYYKIRNESDKLCKDNNLIVIDKYYSEYVKKFKRAKTNTNYYDINKMNTFKSKLKYSIDKTVLQANSYDQFLKIMSDKGYEIKFGKHIAFKHSTQSKFTRSKSINENYTEESIRNRIEDSSKNYKLYLEGSIIDIENNSKVQKYKAYKLWARRHNLKTMAASVVYIRNNNLTHAAISSSLNKHVEELQVVSNTITSCNNCIKHLSITLESLYIKDCYSLSVDNNRDKAKYNDAIKFLQKTNYNDSSYKELLNQIDIMQKKKNALIQEHSLIKSKIHQERNLKSKISSIHK